MSYKSWVQSLPIPWLVSRPVGRAYMGGLMEGLDDQVEINRQATQARFPTFGPSDALPFIADERGIDPCPDITEPAFREDLRTAWDQWEFAGSALGVLLQLVDCYPSAVLVQQNGRAFELDTNGNLVITTLGTNPTIAGIPPWWLFDLDDAHTSRFALLLPTQPTFWRATATATFTGTEDGTPTNPWPAITWTREFDSTVYAVVVGAPTITSGGPVVVGETFASRTRFGTQIESSAPFVGTVDVIAYELGANPFTNPRASELARLRRILRKWAAGKATCMGIFALVQGRYIGWPVRIIGNGSSIGPSTVVRFDP